MLLDHILKPRAVAVVGASTRPHTIGNDLLKRLLEYGFKGHVYPVNPKGGEIEGLRAYTSVSELPDGVDLAVIVVNAKFVLSTVDECAARGIKGLVVISAGFKETGGEGRELEEALAAKVRANGMRMVGPNCLGVVNTNPNVRLDACFAESLPVAGDIGFVSQSGALGGGILNTFLLAAGRPIGKSLAEPDLVDECRKVLEILEKKGAKLPMPVDVVAAKAFAADAPYRVCSVDEVADDEMILDVGPKTAEHLAHELRSAGTIVWNGPVGVFEMKPFAKGTEALAYAIAEATDKGAFSIAGGGDTVSAVNAFGVEDRISYISTGGGAFLEFLEGKTLPAIAVLEERADQ